MLYDGRREWTDRAGILLGVLKKPNEEYVFQPDCCFWKHYLDMVTRAQIKAQPETYWHCSFTDEETFREVTGQD